VKKPGYLRQKGK